MIASQSCVRTRTFKRTLACTYSMNLMRVLNPVNLQASGLNGAARFLLQISCRNSPLDEPLQLIKRPKCTCVVKCHIAWFRVRDRFRVDFRVLFKARDRFRSRVRVMSRDRFRVGFTLRFRVRFWTRVRVRAWLGLRLVLGLWLPLVLLIQCLALVLGLTIATYNRPYKTVDLFHWGMWPNGYVVRV